MARRRRPADEARRDLGQEGQGFHAKLLVKTCPHPHPLYPLSGCWIAKWSVRTTSRSYATAKARYLVGTAKAHLRRFGQALLDHEEGQEVEPGMELLVRLGVELPV
jgi:hypothetical protein